MVPASLTTRVSALRPHVERLLDFLTKRLAADLSDVGVVKISSRPKSAESIFQKLQTGKYADVSELSDLAALTVVVLYRKEVQSAIQIVKNSGLVVVSQPTQVVAATDFRYREPKVYVTPPTEYLDRNPDLTGIVAEIQFTSAIQHALDMTTHDFDYKGQKYSWSNFRLVAQLRGMLELVDAMIDDIEHVSIASHEIIEAPEELIYASNTLSVLEAVFDGADLPSDRRRFADTVARWTSALSLTPEDLRDILLANRDLVEARSIDATSAVLGALLRGHRGDLLANYADRFCISSELDSLCHEAMQVPADRRVDLM